MKQKTYDAWIGKSVRVRWDPSGPVGQVVGPCKFSGWWRVEWPDGSRKMYSQRDLIIVEK